ncbi:hypothetical protein LZU96_15195 [Pantoea agglomerans]|uniref:hypothetical protein n=1 Tax=Enterobacter agglomerans TaxID=549 RepID=UPI001F3172C0|nr:hypothetical protein [Pantoea agglomerans]UIL51563.1 hypothetical protein LZU96_15195 [Pantoea agglomerans]
MKKHYSKRDLLEMDRAGNHYGNHVMAMTAEQLHSKSDIAAELGWRDMQIAALEAKVKQLEWDSVFIPKNIETALAVMGVALPESKEEFNFSINRWVQRLVDRVIRVGPELDAERNNLRAEGVESFAHQQRVIADSLSGDEQRSHRITACRAEDFAAQLRAGKDGE